MRRHIDIALSPSVKVCWRGFRGKLTAHWFPDRLKDRKLVEQFMREAGLSIKDGVCFVDADFDKVLVAAGNRGYSIESIGEQEEECV
jgi:hypothetical protein